MFFKTVNGRTLIKDKKDTITINVGAGNTEDRPVVEFDLKVGDREFKGVPFSIGNRSSNIFKILVGKEFIEQELDALIDVGQENIAGSNVEADL